MNAKQRYDAAMKAAGFIRVQGWIAPENRDAVKALMVTKAGHNGDAGEHLVKIGNKLAKKNK